jgi:hypothetical protein
MVSNAGEQQSRFTSCGPQQIVLQAVDDANTTARVLGVCQDLRVHIVQSTRPAGGITLIAQAARPEQHTRSRIAVDTSG